MNAEKNQAAFLFLLERVFTFINRNGYCGNRSHKKMLPQNMVSISFVHSVAMKCHWGQIIEIDQNYNSSEFPGNLSYSPLKP